MRSPDRCLWLLPLCATLALAIAGGCAAPTASPGTTPTGAFPVTVRDALGNQVTVRAAPQRIVSLAPAMTEILFALGLRKRIVGVTEYCDYPAAARSKPRIGGIVNPSVERILAHKPDLVLGMRLNPKPVLRTISKAGIPVYAAEPRSIDEVLATIGTLGTLTDERESAARLVDGLRERLQTVRRKTRGLSQPTAMLLYSEDPLWVAGADSFPDHAIRLAGGRNAANDVKGYKHYSVEMLLARDPEAIFLTSMESGNDADRLRRFTARPSMRSLSAVKHHRVYVINADIVDRAAPRIVQGVEQIAACLHPQAFTSH